MGFLKKAFIGYTTYMSVYGFSRGYRSEDQSGRKKLLMNRINVGLLNGILYAVPPVNITHLVRLINRLEIENKGLNPRDYSFEYEEVYGECYDTF
jgi:hypothetical protein